MKNSMSWLDVAKVIYRYQKFKGNIAIRNIKTNWADSTKMTYFQQGIYYLNGGKVYNDHFPTSLRNNLDIVKTMNLDILNPNKKNKRKIFAERKHIATYTEEKKSPEIVEKHVFKPVSNSLVGVKYGEMIYLMKNMGEALMFMKGVQATKEEFDIKEECAKIVTVELSEGANAE